MGIICWTDNRRYNRWEHKYYLRIFADIIPKEQRTKYFGWVSAVVGAGTIINSWGLTCKVWSFCTFILWSVHNFIKCFIWYEIHA